MRLRALSRALALAILMAAPTASPAQQDPAQEALSRAIRAYVDLDYDLAATLLRRALAGELSDSDRVEALVYLGAVEHYRGQPDSAAAAFGRLVTIAPGHQPDTLVFPPEITQAFNDVKNRLAREAPLGPPPLPEPVVVAETTTTETLPIVGTPANALAGALILGNVRARSGGGGLPNASGTVLGMSVSARLRRFELRVRYLEGSLGTRELVEGAAAVGFVAASWLTLHAGRQLRRYDAPLGGGAERWMTWQAGVRSQIALGANIRAHAQLWQGFGLDVNLPAGSGSARGGEVGLTIDLPTGPFWLALGYGVDRAAVRGSSRRETMSALTLTAGVRRRP